jgi:hypothetical protein
LLEEFKNKGHREVYSSYQKSTGKKLYGQKPVKKQRPVFLRRLYAGLRAINPLYLTGAIVQVATGLLMVTMAMLFLVKPLWLAGIVSFLGCLTCMLGAFQLYDLTRNADAMGRISRDAINRALNSQN